MELVIIGTYGEKLGHVHGKGSGVYVLQFDHALESFTKSSSAKSSKYFLGKPQLSELKNPTYLTSYRRSEEDDHVLYVVDERYDTAGTVSAATVNTETGELSALGPVIPAAVDAKGAKGAACCNISVSPGGEHVVAANYAGGSVVAISRKADGSLDPSNVQYIVLPPKSEKIKFPGPNAPRQESAHAHMCIFSAGTDSTTVLVPDLGSDLVWSIPYNASSKSTPLSAPVATTAGHASLKGGGPRHVAVHHRESPSGVFTPFAYVAYELTSQVAAFALNPKTGAIADGPPIDIVNAMQGCTVPFLGAHVTGGKYRANMKKDMTYQRLVEGHGAGELESGVCSDKATSLAAVRVTCGNGVPYVIASNRIVNGTGAVSAMPLANTGRFCKDSVNITSTLGRTPRDFAFLNPRPASIKGRKRGRATHDGVLALAANQDTDEITLLKDGKEPKVLTKEIPTPVAMCMIG